MKTMIVRSPRSLSQPRQVAITRPSPATAILESLAAAVAQHVYVATALAVHVRQGLVAPRRQARWVASRQLEGHESPATAEPVALAEPVRVQVRKFLDIFD